MCKPGMEAKKEVYDSLPPAFQTRMRKAWGLNKDWEFFDESKTKELFNTSYEAKKRSWMSREQLVIEFGGAGGNENPEALMEADSWINQCWSYEDDTRPDGITQKWYKWHDWRKKWLFLYEKDVEEDKDGET